MCKFYGEKKNQEKLYININVQQSYNLRYKILLSFKNYLYLYAVTSIHPKSIITSSTGQKNNTSYAQNTK